LQLWFFRIDPATLTAGSESFEGEGHHPILAGSKQDYASLFRGVKLGVLCGLATGNHPAGIRNGP